MTVTLLSTYVLFTCEPGRKDVVPDGGLEVGCCGLVVGVGVGLTSGGVKGFVGGSCFIGGCDGLVGG